MMLKNLTIASFFLLSSFGLAHANLECALGELSPGEISDAHKTADKTATVDRSATDENKINVTIVFNTYDPDRGTAHLDGTLEESMGTTLDCGIKIGNYSSKDGTLEVKKDKHVYIMLPDSISKTSNRYTCDQN